MIKPTYVNFEQAKLLLEKGLTREELGFTSTSVMRPYYNPKGEFNGDCMEFIVTQKEFTLVPAPEQWQVIEWLRVVHGIQVFLDYIFYDGFHYGCKYVKSDGDYGDIWKEGVEDDIDGVSTPQEAYSAAFDYILNNLI